MSEYTFLKGDAHWWRQALVYQIYPRSFADDNGDGIGDLKGVLSRVPYLKKLGIDAVWFSPFYTSALADGGYDVDDYRNIDHRIGTLDEFDNVIDALHKEGIRVIVDIVPNHSGSNHVWFQAALKAKPGSPERDRYIFRDGKGVNGEIRPSELASHFGPTAWTRITEPDGTPGQWYMHLFASEQPDFNWDNQDVRDDFIKTLKFWSDRGVDGYRVDVAHALVKDLANGHLPERQSYDVSVMKDDGTDDLFDRDEVHKIYASWRNEVFNKYDPPRMAVAEAWVHANRRAAYASEKGLGQSFSFDMLGAGWNAKKVRKIAQYQLQASKETGSSTTWVLSNHDVIRHVTRFGLPAVSDFGGWYGKNRFKANVDLELGTDRAKAMTMMLLALPGSTYLYQGEELGLPEALEIPASDMQDPQFFRNPELGLSRDGCRVPLPWAKSGMSFGFGPGGSHLPQPAWYGQYSVEAEDGVAGSVLEFYREVIGLRKQLLTAEEATWVKHLFAPKVLHFTRPNGWQCVTNFGNKPVKLPTGKVLATSKALVNGKLPANATAWIKYEGKKMTAKANIGVVGLAVMGSNLARNLASREGNTVAVYNRSVERTNLLTSEHPEANFIASETIDDFVASLAKPRTAIIMVQAGKGTDAVIAQLAERFEPGDIIVDGGNALFTDTIRREKEVSAKGINFVGAGISGGEEGALKGPSIMPGGSAEAYKTLGPILASIAAIAEGEPCVTHVGTDGAGHFVKMIHNGIEYADMQLIAEAYDILRNAGGYTPAEIAEIFTEWNKGDLESFLIEITAEVLKQVDAKTGKPLVDVILDQAGSKGTGVWTVQTALNLGTPVSGIAEAVFARSLSSQAAQRAAVDGLPADATAWSIEDKKAFVEDVRRALYASKLVAYSQGFDAIRAGAKEYGWNINLGAVSKIWRGGCIIRAQFLNRIADAYDKKADLESLIFDPYFKKAVADSVSSWRTVVSKASLAGIPIPAFASSLSYYDGLRAPRLSASLVQGQRDFFGAHTYKRVDMDGTFHTLWSGDRTEVEQAPSTH